MTDEELGRAEAERLGLKIHYYEPNGNHPEAWGFPHVPDWLRCFVDSTHYYGAYATKERVEQEIGASIRKARAACGYDEALARQAATIAELQQKLDDRDRKRAKSVQGEGPPAYEPMPVDRPHACHETNAAEIPVAWIEYDEKDKNCFVVMLTDAYGDGGILDEVKFCPWCGDAIEGGQSVAQLRERAEKAERERDAALAKCRELEERLRSLQTNNPAC